MPSFNGIKFFCLSILFFHNVFALNFTLSADNDTVLGSLKKAKTISGDTLTSMARRFDMGIMELIEANPNLKLDKIYRADQPFTVPSEFILPDTPHKGIVVNLAELRLYFYVPNTNKLMTFPVGIGRQGWETPLGETYITGKKLNPTWTPTERIKSAHLDDGKRLPQIFLPGSDNPLGGRALYLAIPQILMHGSNDPAGIGRRSSAGCIRMQPEAIESFYPLVSKGLPVTFVDEPIKLGWRNNDLYVEVHMPLQDHLIHNTDPLKKELHDLIDKETAKYPALIDWKTANIAVDEQRGYPIKIGVATAA